jgi:aminoglycoside/choline kinase family phosphotransferase
MLPPDQDERLQQLKKWLGLHLDPKGLVVKRASEDASFRRYFRVWSVDSTYIAMDAPPENENCVPFINVARRLEGHGLNAPHIFQQDTAQGFLLLSDLGNTSYLSKLDAKTVNALYGDALAALLKMHAEVPGTDLPPYDEKLLRFEMSLFVDWFLLQHLKLKLTPEHEQVLAGTFDILAASALEQPRAFVHRDYHSRNLMVTQENNPGILDFQDAVHGPITYDLVSLLRDCYIAWPKVQIEQWLAEHHDRLTRAGLTNAPLPQFRRWFDWMGMQRHLKAIGIFSRLNYRDRKPGYIKDIPRTINYVFEVCEQYPELQPFRELLDRLLIRERLSA